MSFQNRPTEYDDFAVQHRGLAILKTLHRQAGYGSNEQVMSEWLEHLKLGTSHTKLRSELERLRELGVVTTELRGVDGELMVFWLTQSGVEYLGFRITIDGLPRIGPDTNPY